jgi:hypothetical protein
MPTLSTLTFSIGRAIDSYISTNWTYTQVQYQNRTLETTTLSEYVAFSLAPISSSQESITGIVHAGERLTYYLVAQIFVKKGVGTGKMEQLVDYLRGLFNIETRIKLLNGTELIGYISFDVPYMPDNVETEKKGWTQFNISCPFIVYT